MIRITDSWYIVDESYRQRLINGNPARAKKFGRPLKFERIEIFGEGGRTPIAVHRLVYERSDISATGFTFLANDVRLAEDNGYIRKRETAGMVIPDRRQLLLLT